MARARVSAVAARQPPAHVEARRASPPATRTRDAAPTALSPRPMPSRHAFASCGRRAGHSRGWFSLAPAGVPEPREQRASMPMQCAMRCPEGRWSRDRHSPWSLSSCARGNPAARSISRSRRGTSLSLFSLPRSARVPSRVLEFPIPRAFPCPTLRACRARGVKRRSGAVVTAEREEPRARWPARV